MSNLIEIYNSLLNTLRNTSEDEKHVLSVVRDELKAVREMINGSQDGESPEEALKKINNICMSTPEITDINGHIMKPTIEQMNNALNDIADISRHWRK